MTRRRDVQFLVSRLRRLVGCEGRALVLDPETSTISKRRSGNPYDPAQAAGHFRPRAGGQVYRSGRGAKLG